MQKVLLNRRLLIKWCIGLVCLAFVILASLLFLTSGGHYIFCLMNENRWLKARTREQLESRLWSYQKIEIKPAQSSWGSKYVLKDGERMIQYWILKDQTCPLDVVYDQDDRIKIIFTSYE